uniref:SRR1 domain-containing protein n=1 Tax=Heterorhabditis bacteriophora TaxID=37862 RepID=A0A1I7WI60_HETBA
MNTIVLARINTISFRKLSQLRWLSHLATRNGIKVLGIERLTITKTRLSSVGKKDGNVPAQKERESSQLQRSILEEVLISEKRKPTTFTGKVAEGASNTFLYAVVSYYLILIIICSLMEDDGFIIVKKCKSRRRGVVYNERRFSGSTSDIEKAMKKAAAQIESSGLSEWLRLCIRSILTDRRLVRISVIGNGHFDAIWEAGTHQLALAIILRDEFNSELIFQEPCSSSSEREWLSNQSKTVMREDTTMLLPSSKDGVELFLFIHGIHCLLNDFLWFNWDKNTLKNTIILCNNYNRIDLIGGSKQINAECDVLNKYRDIATFISLPSYEPYPSFFANTSVMLSALSEKMMAMRLLARNSQLPHKHEFSLHRSCMATVGRL